MLTTIILATVCGFLAGLALGFVFGVTANHWTSMSRKHKAMRTPTQPSQGEPCKSCGGDGAWLPCICAKGTPRMAKPWPKPCRQAPPMPPVKVRPAPEGQPL